MADLTPVDRDDGASLDARLGQRDIKALKAITAKDFILLTGSKPPAILDRPSWLEAAAKRWDCRRYRFGDIYVRDLGNTRGVRGAARLTATMDGRDWSGPVWVTDLWRKGRVRRGWKLAQRIVAKADDDAEVPKAIRALQLWK